jgi:hypothetical protein
MVPQLYFSRPATVLAQDAVDNESVLARIRATELGARP